MVERETHEQGYFCVVVLWCWRVLAGIAEAIVSSVAYIVNCVYDYSRYYEIRIAVVGMKNSGKSTFVAALKQLETGGGPGSVERDTVPTLTPQVTNVVLRKQGFGVDETGRQSVSTAANGRQSKSVNDTEVRSYGAGDSDVEDGPPEGGEGTSFDVWSSYIRSMKSGRMLRSIRSLRSLRSSYKDHEENSPLLAEVASGDAAATEGDVADHEGGQRGFHDRVRARERVVILIHDLSGQAKHVHLWGEYLLARRSDCIVYVMDLSDGLTLRESRDKLWELLHHNNSHDRLPFLLVGNKADLVDWKTAFVEGGPCATAKTASTMASATDTGTRQRRVMAWLGLQAKGDCSTGVVLTGGPLQDTLLQFDVAVFVVSVLREDVGAMLRWALGAGGENWAGGVL